MTKDESFLIENGYDVEKEKRKGRIFLFSLKAKEAGVKIGQSYKNKAPYDGEGEIMIAETGDNVFPEMLKCIHACHRKHEGLNGSVQYLDLDSLLQSFVIIPS